MTKVESGASTRRRLLDAAQELFAERGFDRVSVREITDRAGANVASVNYHFRSREALVEAVMERYVAPVNEERLARLDQLESRMGSKSVPIEEILDAFMRPFLTQVRRSEMSEKLFFRLMGRCVADQSGELPVALEMSFREVLQRFGRAFAKALPGVEQEELIWRIHFTVGAMIHTMAHGEKLNRISGGASGTPKMDQTLSRLIRYAAAGLRNGLEDLPAGKGESKGKGPQEEFLF